MELAGLTMDSHGRECNAFSSMPPCHANTHTMHEIAFCCTDSMPCKGNQPKVLAKEPNSVLHAEKHRKHAWCDAYVLDLPIYQLFLALFLQ